MELFGESQGLLAATSSSPRLDVRKRTPPRSLPDLVPSLPTPENDASGGCRPARPGPGAARDIRAEAGASRDPDQGQESFA